ncbi:MAG: hypothetical protein V2G41_09390 [bacterium JZ-2024 1]
MIFARRKIAIRSLSSGITLIPFACTHWDHPGCHTGLFAEFINRANDENVYTLGLGDYLDFARSHYRTELRRVLPDEDSPEHLDALVADRLDRFCERIGSLAKRCLGLIEGNHSWTWMTTDEKRGIHAAETSTQYICRKLGIQYLGHTAMVTLELTYRGKVVDRYVILANHGYGGGGSTASADLGRMERMVEPAFDADLYVTAHTHRRLCYFMPEMVPECVGGEAVGFKEKPHLLVKAGAFLRGYIPEKTTYADRKLLRPLDLGWVEISLSYKRKAETQTTVRVTQARMTRSYELPSPGGVPVATSIRRGR